MIVIYYNKLTGACSTLLQAPSLEGFPDPKPEQLALMLDTPVNLPGYVIGTTYYPLPPQTNASYTFNYVTKQWEDPRTIQDFRQEKITALKAKRDSVEFGPFTYNGVTFDGDQNAQRRLTMAAMAAQQALAEGAAWSIDWTMADNTVITLSAADMVGVAEAMGANINAAHEWARGLRTQIEAATTIEELDAIWPGLT